MFQFPAFASLTQVRDTALIRGGLSHSEITGSRDICASPVLFAAYHVLHRLQEPRHPPCALFFLTKYHHHPIKGDGHTSCLFLYWFCLFFQHVIDLIPSRGEREGTESDRQAARRGPRPGTPCGHQSARITQDSGQLPGSPPSLIHRIRADSRKEVFQPHLPVRLPCYDLAPITGFTLGRPLRERTSGTPGFHGLTGGVYKARERIHRANVFTAPWLMRDY